MIYLSVIKHKICRLQKKQLRLKQEELNLDTEWHAKRMDVIRDKLLFDEPLSAVQSDMLYKYQLKYSKLHDVQIKNTIAIDRLYFKLNK